MAAFEHISVLRDEVVEALAPAAGETFVDCTLGGGGHARALLEAADCRVIGIDRDPDALTAAREALHGFGDRFTAVHARFSELGAVLAGLGVEKVDGVLADLGVSSPQLDRAERGFSFRSAGPIDMRMDPGQALSAKDLVDTWSEEALADVIFRYGEERKSRRIAKAIVEGRPWADTASLAAAIARVVGHAGRTHPATRTFQALRIEVNDELGELRSLLSQLGDVLAIGGRVAIITFHSLEDRLVKQHMDEAAGKRRPKDPFGNPIGPVTLRTSGDVASADADNPRARSARLRRAVRIG